MAVSTVSGTIPAPEGLFAGHLCRRVYPALRRQRQRKTVRSEGKCERHHSTGQGEDSRVCPGSWQLCSTRKVPRTTRTRNLQYFVCVAGGWRSRSRQSRIVLTVCSACWRNNLQFHQIPFFQNQVFLESPKCSKGALENQPVVRPRWRRLLEKLRSAPQRPRLCRKALSGRAVKPHILRESFRKPD